MTRSNRTNTLPTDMTAVRIHDRGGPEAIVIERTGLPVVRPKDALVRVVAAAITPSELSWVPTWTHPDGTSRTPITPGHEVAGVVAGLGNQVEGLELGTPVFGLTDFFRDGALAEYVAVQASDLAVRPPGLEELTAAALPLSGLTAWQALFDHGELEVRQRVLIHGATGGVGTFAVQLAKWWSAHVIAVGSPRDLEFLRELGSDEVIDRLASPFEDVVSDIDLVIDTVGGDVLERSWRVLKPGGRVVSIAPSSAEIRSRDPRGRFFVVRPDRDELDEIARLIIRGDLKAVIERTYSLGDAQAAYRFGQTEHPRGKLVIRVKPL
jgi:NADPH:quinone reductase-like Zn-dependent oxidoreductase